MLSRAISEKGIYPAVDPLDSTSRILDARYVGEEHYDVAQRVKQILQRYKDLQDIIAILGIDELSEEDKITVQPGAPDRAVPVAAVLRRRAVHRHPRLVHPARGDDRLLRKLCNGEYDHLPEQAFFMCGGIEDVVEKAKGLRSEDD